MSKKHKFRKVKSKRSLKLKLKTATVYSIVQIVFISLAILILISFSRRGLILIRLNEFLLLLFSWGAIFLPFIFISFALLVSKIRTPLGSPNVIVGMLIFFLSSVSITKAGLMGKNAWEGIKTLVTGPGAFIIFFASCVVGLVIMFNTSLDQVVNFILKVYRTYGFGSKALKKPIGTNFRKDMKVVGGGFHNPFSKSKKLPQDNGASKPDDLNKNPLLEQKLVTNIPGEDKIWKYPDINLLSDSVSGKADRGDIKNNAGIIEQTLESFGITARVVEVNLGPAVTQYALEVALGTKLSRITTLERDLALSLAAPTGTIRIEAPIPGRSLVGIELPNKSPEFVALKKMLESDVMKSKSSKLAMALGLDVSGKPVVADLSKMPHVLIAGQTGSGKSVCINTFLSTLLFRASPMEVKLILVDPKRVELTGYNNIPHLLSPVIVEPGKVLSALRWLVGEMDRRYKLFSQAGAKNIDGYNEMSGFQALPYIVLIIDELADIMLFSPAEVEDTITRIAQMSRATGIHMILSTQRPSVDIITGLIKANIPCRIAFAVASQVDSRVILEGQGAEKLLGRGDMLYLPPEQAKPVRIQGAYLSDKDINSLVYFLKNQGISPQYTEEVTSMPRPGVTTLPGMNEEFDELFKESVEVVCQYDKASSSLLQRRLSVGYARAARIMDQLQKAGVVGPLEGSKARKVLISRPEEIFAKPEESSEG